MQTIGNAAPALAMIAAFLLAVVGARLVLKRDERKRGLLMLGAAVVLVGNVLIWTV